MKEIIIAFCAILAVSTAMVVLNIESRDTPHLLGAKACTWGPSYWCQNLTTAAGCNAVKHCIPKVWEKMQVPKDTDSVCEICENMVKQARDQLESKQTQEDLKAVFEGSCALIHIKPIIKECDKLVDQFIPELVETLASQMNPSVVCSVAGLCNSAHIDKLLEENKNLLTADSKSIKSNIDECSQCFSIANHMENKFAVASRDSVLERFLNICGELSSLSDACSSIVLTHFEAIYNHLQSNLNAKNICHISGQCSEKFHTHENTPMVEVRPLSSTGMVEVGDDLPCELCEKLVSHLRDLLVANTTESEFEQVLLGLCKQTKSFSQECKAIVEQYYPEIYSFLTKRLDGNAICQMASICPLPGKTESKPIWPLVSNENKKLGVQIMSTEIKSSNPQINNIQLTLNKFDTPIKLFDDKYCSSCTFVTNYLKHSIRNRTDRVEVESVIKEMKTVLPGASEQSDEINFLMKYDVALVELILQNKGFSEICELVAVCPTSQLIQTWDKISETSNKKVSEKNKPNCPLCLFAVTQVYEDVKNAMSEDNIKAALNKLCHKLPKQLDGECKEFVEIYSQKVIDYLLKNETPEAVCVQLKLCDPKNEGHKLFQKVVAVPKMDLHGKETCALCEYILHYIQTAVTDPKADDEVKKALDKVCNVLPKQIVNDCYQFIEIYGDAVVSIIAQEIDPSQVCPMIHLCPANQAKYEVVPAKVADKPNCPLCLFGVTQLYNVVKDKKTEESIEKALDTLCVHLPTHLVSPCEDFVKEHSEKIIESMMADLSPQEVCVYLRLCNAPKHSEPEITLFPLDQDGEIMMNEIPNFPLYTVDNKNTPEVTFESDNDKNLKDNSYECKICELVLQYLDKVVDNKKSKTDIEKAFHGACAKLPKRWSAKCDSFVDEYAEIVIELLTQEVSPEQVCTIMELCQSDSKKFEGTIAEFDSKETKIQASMNYPFVIIV